MLEPLVPDCKSLWCISLPSSMFIQWHHVGNLKSAMVGGFTSQKAENATNKDCFPPAEAVVKHLPSAIALE